MSARAEHQPTNQPTKMNTPNEVYRVSTHNQIYSSIYYVVTGWTKAKNGGWKPFHWQDSRRRIGRRGPGGSLGLSFSEAHELAAEMNRELGWKPEMKVLNSKGAQQFDLYA